MGTGQCQHRRDPYEERWEEKLWKGHFLGGKNICWYVFVGFFPSYTLLGRNLKEI